MYENQKAYTGEKAEEMALQSLSSVISDEFERLNEIQAGMLIEIQERLHLLIDKRTPPTPSKDMDKQSEIAPTKDFKNKVLNHISILRGNTNKLEEILTHLKEIV